MLLHAVARSTTLQIISRDFVAPPQGPQWPDLALLRTVETLKTWRGTRYLLLFLPKSGMDQVIEQTCFFLVLCPRDRFRQIHKGFLLSMYHFCDLKIETILLQVCQPSHSKDLDLFRKNQIILSLFFRFCYFSNQDQVHPSLARLILNWTWGLFTPCISGSNSPASYLVQDTSNLPTEDDAKMVSIYHSK